MKWYPIRDYEPPTGCDLIIRIKKDTGSYDRYLIAMCEDYLNLFDASTWIVADWMDINIDLSEYTVTHFCIPDPIEIEND